MLYRIRIAAWLAVAFLSAGLAIIYLTNRLGKMDPPATSAAPFLPLDGEFELTTQHGMKFTQANLTDKPSIVFFGFTNCPDICPTGLFELSALLENLGNDAQKLQPIFVAVDSKRDTRDVVREYLTSFDPRIVGVTGPKVEIDRAVKTFKAYYEIVPGTNRDDYSVNHSAGMFLIDQQKRFVGKLDSHESLEVRLEKLKRLVGKSIPDN